MFFNKASTLTILLGIGLTGQGKSKSLASLSAQYISQGAPVGRVDSYSDLANECLTLLIADGFLAAQNVLYVDFGRRTPFSLSTS